MSEPFIGELRSFGFSFPPRGWEQCNGQLLSISSFQELFALLGTIYGGDGRTNFALPDLRGRSMLNDGQGPGLPPLVIGQRSGSETVTLSVSNLPAHSHELHGETAPADSKNPNNKMLALTAADTYASPVATENRVMSAESITNTGGGQAFGNRDPYLAVNICIATIGIFPERA